MADKITIVLGQKDHRDFELGEVRAVTIPPQTEEITVKSTEQVQVITPTKGKFINKVTVDSVALDKPDQSKTTIPTKERQVVKADLGYELAENIVEPIPDMYADITNVDATAEDVLNGKIFVDNQGNEVQGTAELKEDLDTELTIQESSISNLESAIDNLPNPKPDMLQALVDATNDTSYLLYGRDNLTNVDFLANLDTSKVTKMSNMFSGCSKITTIPQLNTSNVTNMSNMFYGCSNLTTIPQLNTSNVTNMSTMFNNCYNLTTISLLNMINVTRATYMFDGCAKIENITLKNIKISIQIGSGTTRGHLLTDESLINTAKELWDLTGSTTQTLTVSTPSNARFDSIYVKLVDVTDEMIAEDEYITNKKPCIVCESTDDSAMTLREYVVSKNWSLA